LSPAVEEAKMPYLVGALALAALALIARLFAGSWNPTKLVEGSDKRPSTSKLQWFIWTVVVIFSYAAIYATRVRQGHYEALSEIPTNVLVALGLSAGTMTVAKGITVGYVASGKVTKEEPDPAAKKDPTTGVGGLLRDDDGDPDLSKIQMIAWTLIAAVVFLIAVVHTIATSTLPELPDIDPSLVVLMGLGEGAYLGKKLVSTSTPRITGISPGSVKKGEKVTISGASLGESQNGSQITIDDMPIGIDLTAIPKGSWSDTSIVFTVPETHPRGDVWQVGVGRLVKVRVIAGGQSSNDLPLTVSG
jgi:hypothetical protein